MPMSDAPDAVVLALPYRRPFAFDHLLRFTRAAADDRATSSGAATAISPRRAPVAGSRTSTARPSAS